MPMIPLCILAIENEDDRVFMTRLFEQYQRLMYQQIIRIVHDHWETEDILQGTVEKLINVIPKLRRLSDNQLTNYIIAASKNNANNHLRDMGRQDAISFEDFIDTDTGQNSRDVELHMIHADELQALFRIWPQLSGRERYLLEAYYILEKSTDEIAIDLRSKPGSIRMALVRARRRAYSLVTDKAAQDLSR